MRTSGLAACAAIVVLAGSASAGVVFGFGQVTANNVADVNAALTQISVEVDPVGLSQVSFTFRNSGPLAMSITDVYFDDGTLLGISTLTNMAGVAFSSPATPGNLPGGNTMSPAFATTAGFSADSLPPVQPSGVNPGEQLVVTFNLIGGFTFADTITAMNTPGDHLRVGVHVQGFTSGGSESIATPTPGALALLGLAGASGARRRRR